MGALGGRSYIAAPTWPPCTNATATSPTRFEEADSGPGATGPPPARESTASRPSRPLSGASRPRTTALVSLPARHAIAVSWRSDVATAALVTPPVRSLRAAALNTSPRSGAPSSVPPATDTPWPVPLELIAIAGP